MDFSSRQAEHPSGWSFEIADHKHRARRPEILSNTHYQGKMACESMARLKFHRSGKEGYPG
jgi:hypothetical protein